MPQQLTGGVQLFRDPEFLGLPAEAKTEVLKGVDPEFGSLPFEAQKAVIDGATQGRADFGQRTMNEFLEQGSGGLIDRPDSDDFGANLGGGFLGGAANVATGAAAGAGVGAGLGALGLGVGAIPGAVVGGIGGAALGAFGKDIRDQFDMGRTQEQLNYGRSALVGAAGGVGQALVPGSGSLISRMGTGAALNAGIGGLTDLGVQKLEGQPVDWRSVATSAAVGAGGGAVGGALPARPNALPQQRPIGMNALDRLRPPEPVVNPMPTQMTQGPQGYTFKSGLSLNTLPQQARKVDLALEPNALRKDEIRFKQNFRGNTTQRVGATKKRIQTISQMLEQPNLSGRQRKALVSQAGRVGKLKEGVLDVEANRQKVQAGIQRDAKIARARELHANKARTRAENLEYEQLKADIKKDITRANEAEKTQGVQQREQARTQGKAERQNLKPAKKAPVKSKTNETIDQARAGNKDAQKQLGKYGLDYKSHGPMYRLIGQAEVKKLVGGETISSNRASGKGRTDVTNNPDYGKVSGDYRITFKNSEKFDPVKEGSAVRPKNLDEGEYHLTEGYSLKDVAKIEKRTPDGWKEVKPNAKAKPAKGEKPAPKAVQKPKAADSGDKKGAAEPEAKTKPELEKKLAEAVHNTVNKSEKELVSYSTSKGLEGTIQVSVDDELGKRYILADAGPKGSARFSVKIEEGKPVLHPEDSFVREDFRRQGLATELYKAVEKKTGLKISGIESERSQSGKVFRANYDPETKPASSFDDHPEVQKRPELAANIRKGIEENRTAKLDYDAEISGQDIDRAIGLREEVPYETGVTKVYIGDNGKRYFERNKPKGQKVKVVSEAEEAYVKFFRVEDGEASFRMRKVADSTSDSQIHSLELGEPSKYEYFLDDDGKPGVRDIETGEPLPIAKAGPDTAKTTELRGQVDQAKALKAEIDEIVSRYNAGKPVSGREIINLTDKTSGPKQVEQMLEQLPEKLRKQIYKYMTGKDC